MIKYVICIVVALLFVSGCASNKIYVDADEVPGVGAVVEFPTGKITPIQVKRVLSADIIELTNKEKVVLIGIYIPTVYNIPEAAKRMCQDLIRDNEIRFEFDRLQRDSKRRLLAYVFTKDARLINAELIREGLAQVLITPENSKYRERLLGAESEARKAKRGIWSDEFKK